MHHRQTLIYKVTMNIYLNGDIHNLSETITIEQLIVSLNLSGKRIAIEVNEAIIPRSEHGTYQIQTNDKVEVVQAIGGG